MGVSQKPTAEIDLILPHSYEVEELGALPGTGKFDAPVIFIPHPKNRPEHDGLWLRLKDSRGRKWIGVFAYDGPTFSRILSTPDPNRVCVIAKGAGYLVKADDAEAWESIPLLPVMEARLIPDRELLIFIDFVRFAAYGRDGLIWRSPRVCWDDLLILGVEGLLSFLNAHF